MRKTTLRELGNSLPIGETDGKSPLKKNFKLRTHKGWVDRQLAIWREENEGQHQSYLAAKYLSLMIEQVGDESFALTNNRNSTPETLERILKMSWADMMYVYVFARVAAVGGSMEVEYGCPKCGRTGFLVCDLTSLEVSVCDDPAELYQWVNLKDGIKLRTEKIAQKLRMRPVPFHTHFLPGASVLTLGQTGYHTIRESVCAVDCEQGVYNITDEELEEISRVDLLKIDRQSGQVSVGPDMRTPAVCPHKECGAQIRDALNWTYDFFFDQSVPLATLTS